MIKIKFVFFLTMLTFSLSVPLVEWVVDLEGSYEKFEFGDGDLSLIYPSGTSWQMGRIQLWHTVNSQYDYLICQQYASVMQEQLRVIFQSTSFQLIIFGNEISHLNSRLEVDGLIKYSIALATPKGKANLWISISSSDTDYDRVLMDIINQKDSK